MLSGDIAYNNMRAWQGALGALYETLATRTTAMAACFPRGTGE